MKFGRGEGEAAKQFNGYDNLFFKNESLGNSLVKYNLPVC